MLTPMRALLIPVLFATAAGLAGCKPVQTAPPPPPPPRLGPIETPEDIVVEILVRDPEALLEATAVATGHAELTKDALLKGSDKELAGVAELVDLHSSAGAVMTGDPANATSLHFAVALKLKDPKGARAKAAEAVQKGKLKVEDSPAIRSKIYPSNKSAFAFIGEAIVFADTRETIEANGRWIAKQGTEGTPPHDISVRVPLARHAITLRNELKKTWSDELQKDPDAAAADALMKDILAVVSGFGDLEVRVDVEKQDAILDVRLGAVGMFSQWLAKYPAGPARAILAMPKSSSAFVLRFPDALSDWFKSTTSDPAKPASKEGEDFRALARTLGHEVALATNEKHKDSGEWKTSEALLRLELVDPTGARAAVKALINDVVGKPDRKITRAPWAKAGADGESLQVVSGADKYDARWAVKGNYLYVDVAWDGKVTLLDNALDPTGKLQLGANVRAKTFADRLPKDGLIFAYYAETPKAPKPEELGAVPSLEGVRWGWAGASKEALTSQWNVPLADLAAFLGRAAPAPDAPPPPPPAKP